MISLGIVTYQRPDYFGQVLEGVLTHLIDEIDRLYVYVDGGDTSGYGRHIKALHGVVDVNWVVKGGGENRGVGFAKNWLMQRMLDDGAEWLIVAEDDVVPTSPRAISGYIDACRNKGIDHLAFHLHGPGNAGLPVEVDGSVTYWPNSVGAWCIYRRHPLIDAGLLDPAFVNAWEHVEHSMRLAALGHAGKPSEPGRLRFPDATGSENWLAEIPESIWNSSIPQSNEHLSNIERGRSHWIAAHPETARSVFPGWF